MTRVLLTAGIFSISACAITQEHEEVHPDMSFFLTSEGPGDGANLGGLAGADAHCTALAASVDQGHKQWRAYLSTTGENSVDARDRIGEGPWYNAEGVQIARDSQQLHGAEDAGEWLTKATALDERGREFYSTTSTVQDDGINSRHDILTGTQLDGTAFDSDEDTTCENWTLNSGGRAIAGHADRRGGGPHPTSWVYAHPTYGCSVDELARSDGAGLFYCFAVEN